MSSHFARVRRVPCFSTSLPVPPSTASSEFSVSTSPCFHEDDYYDGRHDPRFDYMPKTYNRVPWKSIFLALFLLLLGCTLLLLSFFIFTGHMGGEPSHAYGLLGLGFLTFLPGFYETRIAYYSWRGTQGYHFASIPDY